MICEQCGHESLSVARKAFENATTKLFRERSGFRLFEDAEGRDTFPVYSCDGSPTTRRVFYILRELLGTNELAEVVALYVVPDLDAAIQKALKDAKFRIVNLKGGSLGLPDA